MSDESDADSGAKRADFFPVQKISFFFCRRSSSFPSCMPFLGRHPKAPARPPSKPLLLLPYSPDQTARSERQSSRPQKAGRPRGPPSKKRFFFNEGLRKNTFSSATETAAARRQKRCLVLRLSSGATVRLCFSASLSSIELRSGSFPSLGEEAEEDCSADER